MVWENIFYNSNLSKFVKVCFTVQNMVYFVNVLKKKSNFLKGIKVLISYHLQVYMYKMKEGWDTAILLLERMAVIGAWDKTQKVTSQFWAIDAILKVTPHFHFSLSCIGEGNGNPLQYSCLDNPRDRGACWAAVYRVAQSRTRLTQLSSSSNKKFLVFIKCKWKKTKGIFAMWELIWTQKSKWLYFGIRPGKR